MAVSVPRNCLSKSWREFVVGGVFFLFFCLRLFFFLKTKEVLTWTLFGLLISKIESAFLNKILKRITFEKNDGHIFPTKGKKHDFIKCLIVFLKFIILS